MQAKALAKAANSGKMPADLPACASCWLGRTLEHLFPDFFRKSILIDPSRPELPGAAVLAAAASFSQYLLHLALLHRFPFQLGCAFSRQSPTFQGKRAQIAGPDLPVTGFFSFS